MIAADLKLRLGEFALDANFAAPGEGVTAFVGRSGSGKTTLLRCLAGLEHAKGEVSFDGEVWQDGRAFLPPHRRAVGYVFQDAALFPHLTLADNLRYGLTRAGARTGPAFEEVVALLGLEPLLSRRPRRLSGGERRRGAIGRALLFRPRLLLMDEPTASLDRESREDVLAHIEGLKAAVRLPVIYVTHDLAEVERLADRVFRMDGGRLDPIEPARSG